MPLKSLQNYNSAGFFVLRSRNRQVLDIRFGRLLPLFVNDTLSRETKSGNATIKFRFILRSQIKQYNLQGVEESNE